MVCARASLRWRHDHRFRADPFSLANTVDGALPIGRRNEVQEAYIIKYACGPGFTATRLDENQIKTPRAMEAVLEQRVVFLFQFCVEKGLFLFDFQKTTFRVHENIVFQSDAKFGAGLASKKAAKNDAEKSNPDV